MLTTGQTEARKLHGSLSHPIIDADGHWVEYPPHMRKEFRRIGGDFMFENAVRFWGEVNPDFFKGTVVEKAAAEVLARTAR